MSDQSEKKVNGTITIIFKYAWICLNKQDLAYASGLEYAKILKMVLNMAGFSICKCYTAFWICQNMTWQSSEYTLGSKHARILNMAGFWICKSYNRFLNITQYGWIFLNRTWIYLVYILTYSEGCVTFEYKLMSTYWKMVYSEPCQRSKIERPVKIFKTLK